jgi:hypothetical protein
VTPSTLVAFSSARSRRPEPSLDENHAGSADTAAPVASQSSRGDEPLQFSARARERALVEAWREAHWALRLKLEEVSRRYGPLGIETLYDEARRRDNLLNEFYQARADVLTRELRGRGEAGAPAAPERLSVTERALVARVRAMTPEHRALLLRQAVRLTQET